MSKKNLLTKIIFSLIILSGCHHDKIFHQETISSSQTNKFNAGRYPLEQSLIPVFLLDDEDNERICTGIIIGKNKVLTAAHCLDEFVFQIFIVKNNEKITFKSISIHPKFNDKTLEYDLAIILFGEIFETPYDFLTPSNDGSLTPNVTTGTELDFYGFRRNNYLEKPNLHHEKIKVQTIDSKSIYSERTENKICHGDSGGPLFYMDNNQHYLQAILSKGEYEDCSRIQQNTFTRMDAPEIRTVIQSARAEESALSER